VSERTENRDGLEIEDLVAPMAKREVELEGDGFAVDRGRVLARMAAASRPERQTRGKTIAWSALASAAAVSLVLAGWRWHQHDDAVPAVAALDVAIVAGSAKRDPATDELETAAGAEARVQAPDGIVIDVGGSSHVALRELRSATRRLRVLSGTVRCHVTRRKAEHAFEVVTPDATIVDLGTVFAVSVEGPQHATRVTVEEGEVLIHGASGATRLEAPHSWSNAPEVAPAPAPVEALSPPPPAPTPKTLRTKAVPKAPPAGTLEQESQLLRLGLAAERQGRSGDAIMALSRLLRDYPQSPLAPDARAALSRLEAGTHP
jgi:hypothetical protein